MRLPVSERQSGEEAQSCDTSTTPLIGASSRSDAASGQGARRDPCASPSAKRPRSSCSADQAQNTRAPPLPLPPRALSTAIAPARGRRRSRVEAPYRPPYRHRISPWRKNTDCCDSDWLRHRRSDRRPRPSAVLPPRCVENPDPTSFGSRAAAVRTFPHGEPPRHSRPLGIRRSAAGGPTDNRGPARRHPAPRPDTLSSTASALTPPSMRATLDTARATAAGAQRAWRAADICTVIETAPDPLG